MDFSVPAGALANAVGLVKGCVPARSTIPILNHVLVSATAGEIVVRGTNLDMEATARSGADVAADGAAALPGEILLGIVKRLPKSDLVQVREADGRAEIRCGAAKYALRILPPEDFPVARSDVADGVTFTIACQQLRGLFEMTRYALCNDESRRYLGGVFLHVGDEMLVAVASDGKRLARRTCPLPDGAVEMPGVIVPANAVREICAMLEEGDASVTVTEDRIRVETAGFTFSSSLIDSRFPAYNQLIPEATGAHVTVKPRALIDALDRASVLYTGTDIKAPAAWFRAGNGALDMDAGVAQFDTGTETIDAVVHDATAKFRVNLKFLAEMLKLWPEVDLDIQSSPDGGPILFTAREIPDVTHIIMPQKG